MSAKPPKAGATPQKSRDENSGPLKYVTLSGNYSILGFTCNRIDADANRTNHPSSSVYRAKSLVLLGTRILVDDAFWLPVNSGTVVGWVFAD